MGLADNLSVLPDAVFLLDPDDLTVKELNWQQGTIYGHGRSRVVGKPLAALVPGATPELFARVLAGTHDPHPDVPLRLLARTPGGREVPVDVRVARAQDGRLLLAAFRRISESARVAEREFVTVVCAAPDAILTWSLEGHVVTWNPAAERLFGLHASEAIGSRIEDLVPPAGLAEFRAATKAVLRDGELRRREVFRLRQGQEVEVEESLFLMRDVAQHPIRLGCFARDLSEVSRLRRAAEILSGTGAATQSTPVPTSLSPAMREVDAALVVAAEDSSLSILLLGETGVGKTVIARRIHTLGPRAKRPFLAVNCAALEPHLAESELFGHERGAFTGAAQQKRGLVEAADGGTLFLDEIGELSLAVQAKLLTFLDTRAFRRVGAIRNLSADARIIAATNVNLEVAVAQGAFRADLYYRLKVMPIFIPPLRERREDLPVLVAQLLAELPRGGSAQRVLADEVLRAIERYPWPGNLRELRNALERATLLARGAPIGLEHLPAEVRALPEVTVPGESLEDLERRHILEVLERAGGHRSHAAVALGISRSTLARKLAALGVPKVKPRRR
jgi:PAS domain S-box-containing protein